MNSIYCRFVLLINSVRLYEWRKENTSEVRMRCDSCRETCAGGWECKYTLERLTGSETLLGREIQFTFDWKFKAAGRDRLDFLVRTSSSNDFDIRNIFVNKFSILFIEIQISFWSRSCFCTHTRVPPGILDGGFLIFSWRNLDESYTCDFRFESSLISESSELYEWERFIVFCFIASMNGNSRHSSPTRARKVSPASRRRIDLEVLSFITSSIDPGDVTTNRRCAGDDNWKSFRILPCDRHQWWGKGQVASVKPHNWHIKVHSSGRLILHHAIKLKCRNDWGKVASDDVIAVAGGFAIKWQLMDAEREPAAPFLTPSREFSI